MKNKLRISFVALGWEQLGVSLLSALAKREGYEVHLAYSVSLFNDRYNLSVPFLAPFFDDTKDVLSMLQKQGPDVIAFSCLTGTYQWMLSVAKQAKELFPQVKIVFGGVHVSAVPDRVLSNPQVDYVCVGEGDVAFLEILKAIQEENDTAPIVNTRFKAKNGQVIKGPQIGFQQDLDALPIFDKTIWENHFDVGSLYITMASRGCPYRCTFCFNNFFAELPTEKSGRYVRQRSVAHMMHELRQARKRYKIRMVDFEDDIFTVDKKWLKDFLYHFKSEINVPFECLTHPKYFDEDVAKSLADAGCQFVQMGIQTMDDDYKFKTIKRYENSMHVEKALSLMRKYRIAAKVDHMFGLPGEPLQAQETARELYVKHPPYRIQTFWTNFLPGTKLVAQGLEMGLITLKDVEAINDGSGFDFYRNSKSIRDPATMKIYRAYELIFKLIPVLPKYLRNKISIRLISRLPASVCGAISFLTDLFYGLLKLDPDHINYAKHYLSHIARFIKKKCGLTVLPVTKIYLSEDSCLQLNVPRVNPLDKVNIPVYNNQILQ